jgi:fused signal recognition particle receptor
MNWFDTFKAGLRGTTNFLGTDVRDLLKTDGRLVDDRFLADIFEILSRTDMGEYRAQEIRNQLARDFRSRVVPRKEIAAAINSSIRGLT